MKPGPSGNPWRSLGADGVTVQLVPHRPEWALVFQMEAERILRACGGTVVAVEHIGSTAVPGLVSKPILDIMPGIVRLEDGPGTIRPLEALGYSCRGEHGIPGRLYFDLLRDGRSVAHAHMFVIGTEDWTRHLLFRDYLRGHPDAAREYAELKIALATRYREDRVSYTDVKTGFIRSIVERARLDGESAAGPYR